MTVESRRGEPPGYPRVKLRSQIRYRKSRRFRSCEKKHGGRAAYRALANSGKCFKSMKMRGFVFVLALTSLAACDKAEPQRTSHPTVAEAPISTESLPAYDAQGVISSLEGQVLTLDHDGSAAAGLKAGRDRFTVYADVLAEAPITPGSRVRFSFKQTPRGLEVSRLEGRE